MHSGPKTILPGQMVDGYRILEFLGGGMSHVYKAQDSAGKEVAFKVLQGQRGDDPDCRARFVQEGRIYQNLRHQSVVEGYTIGEHDGRAYMVLEFLRGRSLRGARIGEKIESTSDKVAIMCRVAEVLSYIHRKKIVHLDLKPDNIFLKTDGVLKLTDFGIASVNGRRIVKPGFTLGTPPYMAPEQIYAREVTGRTDLFAFGITLYELLTDALPFTAHTTESLFRKLCQDELNCDRLVAAGVCSELITLIQRCTAKNPSDRPSSAANVLSDLRALSSLNQRDGERVQTTFKWFRGQINPTVKHRSREPEPPQTLIDELSRANCVAFVGAGLSMGAGLPGWSTLLNNMLRYAENEGVSVPDRADIQASIDAHDLLPVADELRDRLGKVRFQRFIRSALQVSNLSPTKAHFELINLPFTGIITTNYDKLLEAAYTIACGQSPLTFTHESYPEMAAALRSGERFILKMHGCIDDTRSIILGTSDYRTLIHDNPALESYLASIFMNRTVLFIGYSLSDPDLLSILDHLKSSYRDYMPRSYALVADGTISPLKARRFAADRGIELITYAPSAPSHPEIELFLAGVSKKTSGHPTPIVPASMELESLAQEVRDWLEAIKYRVTPTQRIDERVRKFTATLTRGALLQRVNVYCVEGELSHADVKQALSSIDLDVPQAWIVADRRVSPRAASEILGIQGLRLFTFSELLRELIWGPYIDVLTDSVAKSQIEERYVDLGCHKLEVSTEGKEVGRDEYNSLDAYVDNWLEERGKVHISILGNFGTGKTWFCQHYAVRRLRKFLENPSRERLPLLITLRDFRSTSASDLLNHVFLQQYKLPFVGDAYESFRDISRRGKLLLILDGFDEMALQADYATVVENFWELAKLNTENSKVILTSRTEYFRWAKESERILAGEERIASNRAAEPTRFDVIYIDPLDEVRIKELVVRRLGEAGIDTANRLIADPNLREMLQKPVLVEMLLSVINDVSLDALKSVAHVYLHATNSLLIRNIAERNTFTSTTDKLLFLCEIAWEMLTEGNLRIHYSQIPIRIRTYFATAIKTTHDLDAWDVDLRSQTLLHRDAGGNYEFAHKSLAEYFVALKLGAETGCLSAQFRSTYRNRELVHSPLPYQPRSLMALRETFGRSSFANTDFTIVSELLTGMVDTAGAEALWELIRATKGLSAEVVLNTSANAVAILRSRGDSFRGRDLSGAVLCGADLPHDLAGVNFSGADLRRTRLEKRDLSNANLKEAIFDPGALAGADLRGVQYSSNILSALSKIPDLPPVLESSDEIAKLQLLVADPLKPLVWVTGPKGSGKSTALACALRSDRAREASHFYLDASPGPRASNSLVGGAALLDDETQKQVLIQLASFLSFLNIAKPQAIVSSLRRGEVTWKTAKPDLFASIGNALQMTRCLIAIDNADACLDLLMGLNRESVVAKLVVSCRKVPTGIADSACVELANAWSSKAGRTTASLTEDLELKLAELLGRFTASNRVTEVEKVPAPLVTQNGLTEEIVELFQDVNSPDTYNSLSGPMAESDGPNGLSKDGLAALQDEPGTLTREFAKLFQDDELLDHNTSADGVGIKPPQPRLANPAIRTSQPKAETQVGWKTDLYGVPDFPLQDTQQNRESQ